MKTQSTFLYDLIHNLSRSEKRYIKVNHGGNEKDYIKLMDAILNQPYFNKDRLLKDNKDANFIRNLSVNKRYLYEVILDSLARYSEKTLEVKVQDRLNAAQVLIQKEMYKAATAELKKGKKLTEAYELFEWQLVLFTIEKQMLSLRLTKKTIVENEAGLIYEAEKSCLKNIQNTSDYWYLNNKISNLQMKFQKAKNKEQIKLVKEIAKDPKFNNQNLAINFRSKVYYFQANSTYCFMMGNIEQAYANNLEFLDFLESNPRFLRLYAERYLATLNNLLIDSFGMGEYHRLKKGMKRLDGVLERPEFRTLNNLEARIFRQKYLLLLNWSLSRKEYKSVLEYIPEIENGLDMHAEKIEKYHRFTFYYLTAYSLFLNRKLDAALYWNNHILNEAKQDVVEDVFYYSRILNLLIHFDLQNYELLDSLFISTPKYLRTKRPISEVEKSLFTYLKKMRSTIDQKKRTDLIREFKEDLKLFYSKPKEQSIFSYLDLEYWVTNESQQ